MTLEKENQIYKRQLNQKKVHNSLKQGDRLFLSLISSLSKKAINHLTIVKPSTLLDWQRRFLKNFWTFKHTTLGRKPVSKDIKELILQMKQENQLLTLVAILRIAAWASIPDVIELHIKYFIIARWNKTTPCPYVTSTPIHAALLKVIVTYNYAFRSGGNTISRGKPILVLDTSKRVRF